MRGAKPRMKFCVGIFAVTNLARHLLQFRKWRVRRAGANVAGLLDDTVEARVDEQDRALALAPIVAVAVLCVVAQADRIAEPTADGALNGLGDSRLLHSDRVIEVGLHEGEQFGTIARRVRLLADAAVVGIGDAGLAAIAGTGAKRERQHYHRGVLRRITHEGSHLQTPTGADS